LGWRSPQQTASDRLKAAKRAKLSAVTQDTPTPVGPTPTLAAPTLAKPVAATMHRDSNVAAVRYEEQSTVPRNLEMPVFSKPNQSIPTATGVRSTINASQAVPVGAIRLKAQTEPTTQRPVAHTTRAQIKTAQRSTPQQKQTRASNLAAPRKLSPALRLQATKSILKDRDIQTAPVAEPDIQVVQNLRDLEMPLSDFLDEDLMGEAEDVLNDAPDAPSPEDFFNSRDASDTRVIQREQFKDETPLSNLGQQNQFDASPETRSIPNTLPVQADEGSRFGDPEPLQPQQPSFTPPPAIDQPSLDQRSSDQSVIPQDSQPYPAFQPPAVEGASNENAANRSLDYDEPETSLADELE